MQPKTSKQALGLLSTAQKTVQNPQAYLSQASNQLGVNAAQQSVDSLRGAINNTSRLLQGVAPSVMGRTRSSLVNAAQANRITQNEQAPIAANLAQQTSDYGQAASDLAGLRDRALQQAQLGYQGQQDNLSYLQNIYNTLYEREQQDRQFAEQRRQFDAEQARLSRGSGEGGFNPALLELLKPKAPTVQSLFSGYNPTTDRFYTEQVVIPTLMSELGWDEKKAKKAAYDYRKKAYGE